MDMLNVQLNVRIMIRVRIVKWSVCTLIWHGLYTMTPRKKCSTVLQSIRYSDGKYRREEKNHKNKLILKVNESFWWSNWKSRRKEKNNCEKSFSKWKKKCTTRIECGSNNVTWQFFHFQHWIIIECFFASSFFKCCRLFPRFNRKKMVAWVRLIWIKCKEKSTDQNRYEQI